MKSNRILFYSFIFLYTIGLFYNISTMPLVHKEPRNAVIAFEMSIRNSFIKPTVLNKAYYKKPPLYDTIIAFMFKIFGAHKIVMRLFSSILLVAVSFVIFFVTSDIFGFDAAFFGTFAFATSIISYFIFGSLGQSDILFCLFMLIGVLSFLDKKFLISFLFITLAFFTGGLIALFLFYSIFFIHGLIHKTLKNQFFSKSHIFGMIAFIIILSIWLFLNAGFDRHKIDYILGFYVLNFINLFSFEPISIIKRFIIFFLDTFYYFFPVSLILLFALKKSFLSDMSYYLKTNLIVNKLFKIALSVFIAYFVIFLITPGLSIGYGLIYFVFLSIFVSFIYYIYESIEKKPQRFIFKVLFLIVCLIEAFSVLFQYQFLNGYGYIVTLIFFVLSVVVFLRLKNESPFWTVLFLSVFLKLTYACVYVPYTAKFHDDKPFAKEIADVIQRYRTNNVSIDLNNMQLIFYVERYLNRVTHSGTGSDIVVSDRLEKGYGIIEIVDLKQKFIYIEKKKGD